MGLREAQVPSALVRSWIRRIDVSELAVVSDFTHAALVIE